MFGPDYIQRALIAAPVILFSLTVHEFFHAYLAYRYGDSTAKDMGRLTFNPLAHLDLFGTLMMFLSEFRFGWAKPVPVNPYNLRNPRTADIWISAAGPLSNMGLAFIAGLVFRLLVGANADLPSAIYVMLQLGVSINISLAFFNMIPIFPLDGSHILRSLMPPRYESQLAAFERFAPFILIFLIVSGATWFILRPPVIFFYRLFTGQ